MDFNKYIEFDSLYKIGNYKKLIEELKDFDLSGNKIPKEKLTTDQALNLYFINCSKLGLGKYAEIDKFLSSDIFKQFINLDDIANIFMCLVHLIYNYELEIYSSIPDLPKNIDSTEESFKDESFILEIIGLIYTYKSFFSYKQSHFEEYERYNKKSTDFLESLDNSYYSTIYYLLSSQINGLKGKSNLAQSHAQESYEQSILTKNISLKAYTLLRLAEIIYPRGQINQALDNCENVFIIGRKTGNLKLMGMSFFINAKINHSIIDLEQARGFADKAKEYFANINYNQGLMLLNNLYGNINHLDGELDRALKFFESAFDQSREFKDLFTEAMVLNNIGNIYSDKGLFGLAIDNYSKSLDLATKINYIWIQSIVLGNLGSNYHLKADYAKSIEYYKMALSISSKADQKPHIAGIYFNLIISNLELKNTDEIELYFEKLREMTTKDNNKLLFYYYEIARALIQKNKTGLTNIVESQSILRRILNENIPHTGLKQIVIINLADLMIKELSIEPNNEDILIELNTLIDKLYAHGKEQNAYHIIIEALILKSKITLIEGNIKQAERLLVQASILAEEKNLTYLVNKTDQEYKLFRKEITKWSEIIENNSPLVEKLKLTEIQSYISDLRKIAFK